MKKHYKMVDGVPIWQHLKNGAKDHKVKLVARDYGEFAEIVGRRVLNRLTEKGGILDELFPEIEIISVHTSPKTRIIADAKIELGDLTLEIDYKDGSGRFRKKIVIFEIKHGHFQIEQNQFRRYCLMINNPDGYFPKADEVKVVFMMFGRIDTIGGSASYSISELDKEFASKVLENCPLSCSDYSVNSVCSLGPDLVPDLDKIDANVAEGLKKLLDEETEASELLFLVTGW
jgi:hypothetical protein